jgi:colanic acid/amylovoran biosynthesis glycosyltransferase
VEGDGTVSVQALERAAAVGATPAPQAREAVRVLYVVSLFPCWSETFIVREIQALVRAGVDVRIVSLRHASEDLVQSDAAALLDRVLHPVPFGRSFAAVVRECLAAPLRQLRLLATILGGVRGSRGARAKSLVAWWRTLALADRVRALAPQLIHAHWATYPSTAALILSRSLGIPFSFTCHAHDIFVEDHLVAAKLRGARFAVTISDYNKALLAERHGAESVANLHVVRCGVALPELEYRPSGRQAGSILAIGRLDPIKGFRDLIEACALLARHGVVLRCDVIGEGPERRALEAQIARCGLQDSVRLLGAMKGEQVREHLYRAAVFVMPSVVTAAGNSDGIPVALMEAMAAGAPVVATTVSAIPELVRHGTNGLLAAPGDPEALAERLRTLLSDPELGRGLAARARETVERRFNSDVEAQRLRALLNHALDAGGER